MSIQDRLWLWWHRYCAKHLEKKRWDGHSRRICTQCYNEQVTLLKIRDSLEQKHLECIRERKLGPS